MDSVSFKMCTECVARYRDLEHDSGSEYSLNIMPFCSLQWPDEHPEDWYEHCCEECQLSIRHLSSARTGLWRTGEIPDHYLDFWKDANTAIPEWPGFRRLSLSKKELDSLDGCSEELDDMMGAITEDFPDLTVTDQGGGLTKFTAERDLSRKRWWQFWR